MKQIIIGTNRLGSNTSKIAQIVKSYYEEIGEKVGLIDLAQIKFTEMAHPYSKDLPNSMTSEIEKINSADGLIMVVPEYNGSFPGVLKYFIDQWTYPISFEARPVCFIGLGGRWGGLRPIEQLQQVFNYRNAYAFPERVFITGVDAQLRTGTLTDAMLVSLLKTQTKNFTKFVQAIDTAGLHAKHRKS